MPIITAHDVIDRIDSQIVNKEGWVKASMSVIVEGVPRNLSNDNGYSIIQGAYFQGNGSQNVLGIRWNGYDIPDSTNLVGREGFPLNSTTLQPTFLVLPRIPGLYETILNSNLIPEDKKSEAYKFLGIQRKSWITISQKKYIARIFMSLGVVSIISIVTALYGRLELNGFEYLSLYTAAIGTSVFGFLLEKD